MKTSTGIDPSPKSSGRLVYSEERMRAIFVGRAVESERDLARHHVDFVAVGERDDDVGFLRSGGFQNRRVRGVSCDRADIQPVLQVAQDVLVDVDDGDLVRLFTRQVEGGGPADLPGPRIRILTSAPG